MEKQQITELLMQVSTHVGEYVGLKAYTTLQIGGLARYLIEPDSLMELQNVMAIIKHYEIPFLILGNGSNILFSDQGYDGVVVVLSKTFAQINIEKTKLYAQAGASLKKVCEVAEAQSLSGMEFAYGIPGSVGGAVYMNAGAYGGEIKNIVTGAHYLTYEGEVKHISFQSTDFGYRHSFFSDKNLIILEVEFSLNKGNYECIHKRMFHLMKRRIEKQPLDYPSAGSTFKRPKGNYAGALIEQCGLKGYQVGGSMVSKKHSGFLINANKASSTDFIKLIHFVQKEVFEKTGYHLECEIKLIKN